MKVEVEVISKEIIKPSSPTPNHLRHYQLSFLDQINPPIYGALVLFYEFNGKTQPPTFGEMSKHLKKSLAEVLTLFYPLAGRVKIDNHFVDCNDEGVPYLEALVKNYRLCDALSNPISDELHEFIPFIQGDHIASEFALGIQFNMFECGGFAIGLCFSHKLGDGLSMNMFAKTWAAISRGETDEAKIERPQFASATLIPPKEITRYDSGATVTKKNVTKRFLFDAHTIEDLRAKYTGLQKNEKPPSRVETLSAFMWRRFLGATKHDDGRHIDGTKLHSVIHTVNLRRLFDPPLSRHAFGNIYRISWTAPFLISSSSSEDDDQEISHVMVRQVREGMSKIDKDYVKRLQHGDEHLKLLNPPSHGEEVITSNYSSFCGFPLYDTDFGWGRPKWVALPPMPVKNFMIFVDTKEGGGIEVYVTLTQEVMAKFESDTFLQQRVGNIGRFGSANSSLTHRVGNFHTRNKPGVISSSL